MRAPGTKRGRRFPAALAAAAVAVAGALLALRAEGGPARAEPGAAARPAPAQPAAAPSEPIVGVSAAAAPVAPAVPAPAARPPPTEEELMERERAEVDAHPEVAVALADECEARFPSGRSGDERALLKMRALVHLGEIGVARAAAAEFFERHPDSPLGRDVFRLTGMRPPPVLGPRT